MLIDAREYRKPPSKRFEWNADGPYLGEEEIRQMPDPSHKPMVPTPVVKPRLKTAPRINRFNIRQDGDSKAVAEESMKNRK